MDGWCSDDQSPAKKATVVNSKLSHEMAVLVLGSCILPMVFLKPCASTGHQSKHSTIEPERCGIDTEFKDSSPTPTSFGSMMIEAACLRKGSRPHQFPRRHYDGFCTFQSYVYGDVEVGWKKLLNSNVPLVWILQPCWMSLVDQICRKRRCCKRFKQP